MKHEKEIFSMITYAGDANRYAFEALEYIESKDYEKAKHLLEEGRKCMNHAHQMQTDLLVAECSQEENGASVSLMMVHAQDHLMNAMLALDLIEKLTSLFASREEN